MAVSIFDLNRLDRAAIWSNAEDIARIEPRLSFAECLFRAASAFEGHPLKPSLEDQLLDAVCDAPHTLMKAPYGHP